MKQIIIIIIKRNIHKTNKSHISITTTKSLFYTCFVKRNNLSFKQIDNIDFFLGIPLYGVTSHYVIDQSMISIFDALRKCFGRADKHNHWGEFIAN